MKSSIFAIAAILGLIPLMAAARAANPMETPGPELKPRETVSDALAPWISIDTSKSITTTITPVVTTDSAGVTTTLHAQPTGGTLTNTTDGVKGQVCTPQYYVLGGPFCQPSNDTVLYVKQTYLITWYGQYWKETGGTVGIFIEYVDELQNHESNQVWNSQNINPFNNVVSITVDPNWMDGKANRTVKFRIERVFDSSTPKESIDGPIVTLSTGAQPKQPYKRTPRSTIALAVVLPCTALLIVLLVWAVFHFNRSERAFDGKGLRARLGRKKFRKGGGGYGERQSRAQRMGAAPLSPTAEGEEDWEMTAMSGGGRDAGNTTATGGFSSAPRERSKPSPNNPFSD